MIHPGKVTPGTNCDQLKRGSLRIAYSGGRWIPLGHLLPGPAALPVHPGVEPDQLRCERGVVPSASAFALGGALGALWLITLPLFASLWLAASLASRAGLLPKALDLALQLCNFRCLITLPPGAALWEAHRDHNSLNARLLHD